MSSIELNEINRSLATQVGALLDRPKALGALLASVIASTLELPEGPVANASQYFNLSFRTRVNAMVSMVNECYLVPVREVIQLAEGLYCMRLSIARPNELRITSQASCYLSYFTNADHFLTPAQCELLNTYATFIAQNSAKMAKALAPVAGALPTGE